jgi:hypothetical protein
LVLIDGLGPMAEGSPEEQVELVHESLDATLLLRQTLRHLAHHLLEDFRIAGQIR